MALLYDKEKLAGDPESTPGQFGPPPVPVIENIHQRVYEAASATDALDMHTPHACSTTHCRAGWVVHLAGKAGYALENHYDWCLAAMKIYDASSSLPPISPVQFFTSNEDALADMKRLADAESALGQVRP